MPFQSLYNLKWDLGLLDDFDRNLIRKYPDCFRVVKGSNVLACLKLLKWDDEFVVFALQSSKMKFLQRIAYLNVGLYPFTSFFLIVYCFLPTLSLLSGQFIVQSLKIAFLVYLLAISLTLCNCMLAILEIKCSGIDLEEW
ncbi:hypothetical protein POM88_054609 [Heracleum sosnowskyi]|uniref:PORR domain-containing protein n=1 Tax=Heracleum sosnowskyi TaxID=360622 RepID=A0AAD8LWF7_9APIA|nr:hypothetical protein POM88_054607 [Heracleum sosnowskyi]KAK1350659.1 hypothetical protein POM88_054608 [Heracleum sosnowskyi]KAK1350660.1 hypothetical protein POM88_054609 [Heracleum sosnowskyi]